MLQHAVQILTNYDDLVDSRDVIYHWESVARTNIIIPRAAFPDQRPSFTSPEGCLKDVQLLSRHAVDNYMEVCSISGLGLKWSQAKRRRQKQSTIAASNLSKFKRVSSYAVPSARKVRSRRKHPNHYIGKFIRSVDICRPPLPQWGGSCGPTTTPLASGAEASFHRLTWERPKPEPSPTQ